MDYSTPSSGEIAMGQSYQNTDRIKELEKRFEVLYRRVTRLEALVLKQQTAFMQFTESA